MVGVNWVGPSESLWNVFNIFWGCILGHYLRTKYLLVSNANLLGLFSKQSLEKHDFAVYVCKLHQGYYNLHFWHLGILLIYKNKLQIVTSEDLFNRYLISYKNQLCSLSFVFPSPLNMYIILPILFSTWWPFVTNDQLKMWQH